MHPECRHEVVTKADLVGLDGVHHPDRRGARRPGSAWAIGTELNLVRRLADAHPDKQVTFLDRTVCYCSTMNRIDLPHLVWALEQLVDGRVVNRIVVDPDTAHWARVALDRMLALPACDRSPRGQMARRIGARIGRSSNGGAPQRDSAPRRGTRIGRYSDAGAPQRTSPTA